jgi:hypothetical protein
MGMAVTGPAAITEAAATPKSFTAPWDEPQKEISKQAPCQLAHGRVFWTTMLTPVSGSFSQRGDDRAVLERAGGCELH